MLVGLRIKVTWPELKYIDIRRTRIVDLGYVNMSAYNFVRCGQNFTKFFLFSAKKIVLLNPFRFCRYLHRFQEYLRSNSKVVVKRTKFWTFFALPNFKGGVAPKRCTCVIIST